MIKSHFKDLFFQARDILMLEMDSEELRKTLLKLYKRNIVGTSDSVKLKYCYGCGFWICPKHFKEDDKKNNGRSGRDTRDNHLCIRCRLDS